MSTLRNKVSLIGVIGAEPEVVTFEGGKMLARFTVATKENYKDASGNWHDTVQWHSITAWNRIAQRVLETLHKGYEVIVEGKLVHQTYETKDGEKRFGTIIEMHEFLILKKA